MIYVNFSADTKVKNVPLTWCRVTELNYEGGFYFRCPNGHLSLFTPPEVRVSNIRGIEGTVSQEITCLHVGCDFKKHIFLNNWKFDFEAGT